MLSQAPIQEQILFGIKNNQFKIFIDRNTSIFYVVAM